MSSTRTSWLLPALLINHLSFRLFDAAIEGTPPPQWLRAQLQRGGLGGGLVPLKTVELETPPGHGATEPGAPGA